MNELAQGSANFKPTEARSARHLLQLWY